MIKIVVRTWLEIFSRQLPDSRDLCAIGATTSAFGFIICWADSIAGLCTAGWSEGFDRDRGWDMVED